MLTDGKEEIRLTDAYVRDSFSPLPPSEGDEQSLRRYVVDGRRPLG